MSTVNTKLISTRIKNKIDTLDNWQQAQEAGGKLLLGEIALVQVTEQQTDDQGNIIEVPALLMKVGTNYTASEAAAKGNAALAGTAKPFDELPWLSAKAADVYSWAKGATAEDVKVKVTTGTGESVLTTTKSLSDWLKLFKETDATHDSKLANIENTLKTLVGEDGAGGSIADAIEAAINALDHVDVNKATNTIVKAVTQEDGKVTVTYGAITNDELPDDISANKIAYTTTDGTKTNVKDQLDTLSAGVSGVLGSISVDPEAATSNGVVQSITYDSKGKFIVGYDTVKTDDIADSAITTAKIADANVTTSKIADKNVTTEKINDAAVTNDKVATGISSDKIDITTKGYDKSTLTAKVEAIESKIANINTEITGGIHFRGITTTALSDGDSTSSIKLVEGNTEKDYTLDANNAGDVVIYRDSEGTTEREFIWTGTFWEELGDLTRIGALEAAVDAMDYAGGEFGTSQFVTKVTQTDGKVSVEYAQPDSGDISHTSSANGSTTTVSAELADHTTRLAVTEAKLAGIDDTVANHVKGAIESLAVEEVGTTDQTGYTGSNGYTVIATVSQTDGKVNATTKDIPTATNNVYGIVKLSDDIPTEEATSNKAAAGKTAATPEAVRKVNVTAEDAQTRVAAVEGNYVRFANDNKLYVGKEGTDVIIFDCGGASGL